MTRMFAALVVLALVFSVGCGGGSSGGGVMPPAPLVITGDYSININPTVDTCGLPLPGFNTAMHVQETGATQATADIPIGGNGGQCNPIVYARTGNSLRAPGVETFQFDFGCRWSA